MTHKFLKMRRAYLKQWRERQRAQGLCRFCKERAIEGLGICSTHQAKTAVYDKRKRVRQAVLRSLG